MTAVAVAPVQSRSSRDIWLVSAGHALTHWYPATFYLLLPLIGNELGLSYGQIGSFITVQYAAGAIANVPGGMVVDSIGRKGLLMALSLFWVGFPYLMMGFTHAYWLLLGCAALVGIGNNLWHPTAIPLIAERFPDRKGLAVSLHGMGANLGDALAPLVAGGLLAVMSWREVVVVNVVPGVIMSCLILWFLGREPAAAARATQGRRRTADMLRAMRELLTNRAVLLLSVSSACRTLTQNALLTFLPVYLASVLGYSPVWVGGCMFGLQVAGFAAAPLAGHLSDRMGRRRIIMSSMAMSAVVLLFMTFAGGTPAFVVFVGLLGFFLFAIRAVLQAWLLDATPARMGGTAIGIMFGLQAVGSAIGPFVGGLLADRYGLMAAFYFLAVTIVVANLFVFLTPSTLGRATHTGN